MGGAEGMKIINGFLFWAMTISGISFCIYGLFLSAPMCWVIWGIGMALLGIAGIILNTCDL